MVVTILVISYVRKNGEKEDCSSLHSVAMKEISMKEGFAGGESSRLLEIAVSKETG